MTEYTVDFLNVEEFVQQEKLPEKVLKRGPDDVWHVCRIPISTISSQVELDGKSWTLVRDGELVRIPLVPYRCKADAAACVAAALERGICIGQFLQVPMPALRVHMIVGNPVEHFEDEQQYRFWLGFAIRVK